MTTDINNNDTTFVPFKQTDNGYFLVTEKTLPADMKKKIVSGGYVWDRTYYNELCTNEDYERAYRYMRCFHFNDLTLENDINQDAEQYRVNNIYLKDYFQRLSQRPDIDKEAVNFAFHLYDNSDKLIDNSYAKEFFKYKSILGSQVDDNGKIIQEADWLQIDFAPKEQQLLGFIPTENDMSFDALLYNLSTDDNIYREDGVEMNQAYLEQMGIIVKDGSKGHKIIEFDKTNPFANQILCNLPIEGQTNYPIFTISDEPFKVTGYRKNENGILQKLNSDDIHPIDPLNTLITLGYNDVRSTDQIYNMIHLYQSCNDKKYDYDHNQGGINFQEPIIIGRMTSDALNKLDAELEGGEITDAEYDKRRDKLIDELKDRVQSSSVTETFYANIYDNPIEEDERAGVDYIKKDMTLREVDDSQKADLTTLLSSTDPKDISIFAGYKGQDVGMYVTIYANQVEYDSNGDLKKADVKRKAVANIFIPGFCSEEMNRIIQNDPLLQANREVNMLSNFDYTYYMEDGTNISYNKVKSQFVMNKGKDEKYITEQDAIRKIMCSKAVQSTTSQMLNGYLRMNGKITDNINDYISLSALNAIGMYYSKEPDKTDFLYDVNTNEVGLDVMKRYLGTDENGNYGININSNPYERWVQPLNIHNYIYNHVQQNLKPRYSK